MEMPNLARFARSMHGAGLSRAMFTLLLGGGEQCVVLIDEPTSRKLFIGGKSIWQDVDLTASLSLSPILPNSAYLRLASIVRGATTDRLAFKTGEFFKELDRGVPGECVPKMLLRPQIAAKLFGQVAEAEKHFFMGFSVHEESEPSAKNLEKTRLLLGDEAYQLCKALRASSRWSANPSGSVRFLPELGKLRKVAMGRSAHSDAPLASAEPGISTVASSSSDTPSDYRVLCMLCGPAGVGKSVLAREVAKLVRPPLVVLDLDVFTDPLVQAALQSCDDGPVPPHIRNAQYKSMLNLAFDLMSQGLLPLCVGRFSEEIKDQNWCAALRQDLACHGVQLKLASLVATREDLAERLKARGTNCAEIERILQKSQVSPVTGADIVVDTGNVDRLDAAAKLAGFFERSSDTGIGDKSRAALPPGQSQLAKYS